MTRLPIAITLGDPAGIGPEIIAKAFRDAPQVTAGCFVVGDVALLRRGVQFVSQDRIALPVLVLDRVSEALTEPPNCIPVLQIAPPAGLVPVGQVSAVAGRAAANSIV